MLGEWQTDSVSGYPLSYPITYTRARTKKSGKYFSRSRKNLSGDKGYVFFCPNPSTSIDSLRTAPQIVAARSTLSETGKYWEVVPVD